MEDILTVLPFGGTVDLVQIKGSTVKKAFEHAVHRYGSMSGEFLQVSGLLSGSLFLELHYITLQHYIIIYIVKTLAILFLDLCRLPRPVRPVQTSEPTCHVSVGTLH